MKYDKKFEQIYSKLERNNYKDLEILRRDIKRGFTQNAIVLAIAIVEGVLLLYTIFYGAFCKNIDEQMYAFIIGVIIFLFEMVAVLVYFKLLSKNKSKVSEYSYEYKTKVIKDFLSIFNETITYKSDYGINEMFYIDAEFQKKSIYSSEIYSSEDAIYGNLKNDCFFVMAQVITRDSTSRDYYGDDVLFCGMFSMIQVPKPFNVTLYLRRDMKDKSFMEKAFRLDLPFDDLRVEVDSQEFEKMFDVYCSDKIVAMQLLTADVMQLLVDFQNEMNMEYEVTVKNNRMYIRFMSGSIFDFAEITEFSLDKKNLYECYKILDFIFTLNDKLINILNDTEI